MSRIVVTGGAGRLGRSVVRGLAEHGHEVVSIDRGRAPGLEVEQVEHDLSDAPATAALFSSIRPQRIVHLAAIAVPFSAPDATMMAVNTGLAFSVLEAALACEAESMLVASSPTVIGYGAPGGWSPTSLPIDERHPTAPWNGYALSKVALEQLVAMAARAHGDRLRIGAFRPCYVIAPEEWAGAPTQQGHTVLQRLARPELSAVALFNYLDARDAADFVHEWGERASDVPNGEVLFVGAEDSLVREPVPEALARLVPGAAAHALRLGPTDPVFSSARARELLGWRPRRSWRSELGEAEHPVATAASDRDRAPEPALASAADREMPRS